MQKLFTHQVSHLIQIWKKSRCQNWDTNKGSLKSGSLSHEPDIEWKLLLKQQVRSCQDELRSFSWAMVPKLPPESLSVNLLNNHQNNLKKGKRIYERKKFIWKLKLSRTKEFLQQKKTMAWNVSLNLEGFVFLFLRKCEKRLCSIWTWYPRTNTIQMNVLTIKLNGNVWMTDALIRSQRSWVSS